MMLADVNNVVLSVIIQGYIIRYGLFIFAVCTVFCHAVNYDTLVEHHAGLGHVLQVC